MDLGGGKGARGNEAIAGDGENARALRPRLPAASAISPGCRASSSTATRAVATSYLQIITPDRQAAPREVSGHGSTTGFRIHRVGRQPLGAQARQGRMESRRDARCARSTAPTMRGPCCGRRLRRKFAPANRLTKAGERDMPKAYWVVTYRSMKNPEAWKAYAKLARAGDRSQPADAFWRSTIRRKPMSPA